MDKKHINDIVEELTLLADVLSKGQIRVGAHFANISGPVFFKTKKKVKGDKITIELSLEALLDNKDLEKGAIAAAVGKEKFTSKKARKEKQRKPFPAPKKTGLNSKKIKKDLNKLWKTVSTKIVKQEAAGQEDITALRRFITTNPYAGKPWEKEWLSCCDTMKKCLDAVTSGDYQSATALVAESNRMRKNCHKMFK